MDSKTDLTSFTCTSDEGTRQQRPRQREAFFFFFFFFSASWQPEESWELGIFSQIRTWGAGVSLTAGASSTAASGASRLKAETSPLKAFEATVYCTPGTSHHSTTQSQKERD